MKLGPGDVGEQVEIACTGNPDDDLDLGADCNRKIITRIGSWRRPDGTCAHQVSKAEQHVTTDEFSGYEV